MEEQKNQKRQVAYKVGIKDVVNGSYVKEEGWEPNYALVNGIKVSRANIIGVIISIEEGLQYRSVILDDGDAKISVRTFDENKSFDNLRIGNLVSVIGRPREYGRERYLLAEIVKVINTSKWLKVRKLEINNTKPNYEKPLTKDEVFQETLAVHEETPFDLILDAIKRLDKGEGADFDEVIKNIPDGENIVKSLMINGDVFEVRPGKLKIL